MRKVIAKSRQGSKIRKQYDQAKAPIQRLFETNGISDSMMVSQQNLIKSLNPLDLHRKLESLLQQGTCYATKRFALA